MTELKNVKVGDTLLLFPSHRSRQGGVLVEVVKVGRTLVYVDTPNARHPRRNPDAYRMDTGCRNDEYGHSYVMTHEQVAEQERRTAALAEVKALGLEPVSFTAGYRLTSEQLLAVAEALRSNAPKAR